MHTLHLHALDSYYATDDEMAEAGINPNDLPPSFRLMPKQGQTLGGQQREKQRIGLMAHQAKTIAALRLGNAPIIINTAKTGDGKSFAGQYPIFTGERRGVIMYPTNELAADQRRSLNKFKADWSAGGIQNIRWEMITALRLDEIQQAIQINRPESLKLLLNNDLLLTNPDIFHLMMQFRYRAGGAAADLILGEIVNRFDLFIFDEFHIFNIPQVLSALVAMLLLLETTGGDQSKLRFLFLSATPQERDLLPHLANVAGIPFTLIKGQYESGKPEPNPDYQRRILQRTSLHLYERDGLEAWVEANLDQIIAFFQQNPGARGVILANSVATAYRVHKLLIEPCRQAGIHLGDPNTGLIPSADRKMDAELFVATSTVDVGVDFKINFLVFESVDAATHTQRLGRLGRHEKNDKDEPFTAYVAHALLPSWVIESVKAKFPDESEVDREHYESAIREAYSKPQAFDHYRYRWAGIQAGRVLAMLENKEIRHEYASTRARLYERYQKLFPRPFLFRTTIRDCMKETPEIFNEASSFRGSSPFTALVLNTMSKGERILPYNLITLLQQGVLAPLSWDEVEQREGENAEVLMKSQPLIAYRLLDWLPKQPRRVSILLNEPASDWSAECFETVIEQDHFRLQVEGGDIPDLYSLNEELEQRSLVVLLVRNADPDGLRWKYRLGLHLELFSFRTQDGTAGCAAFGRDALLLDSLIYRQKPKTDNPMFG